MTGHLYGIGVGPGDPELLTLRALRLLKTSPVISYFAKAGRTGHARTIVAPFLPDNILEEPLFYPITTEHAANSPIYKAALEDFYAQSRDRLAAHLQAGRDVALLSEGDPLFYGSFMHLHVRLRPQFPVTVVPGVSGMAGCWSAAAAPMAWGEDILTILPATLPGAELVARLRATDAAVIMKLGRNFSKARQAVTEAGCLARAIYVARGTMAGEIVLPLSEKTDASAPYFAMILIPGERP